jgi:endoglucanase
MASRLFLFASAVAALTTPQTVNQNSNMETTAMKNFKFFGINESGPEFGEKVFPGVKNKEVGSAYVIIKTPL